MSSLEYTADEMMTVAASRALWNGAVCFVGIGMPSAAANLARLTHAPDVVLIYESGTVGARPDVLPLSIGDGELSETATTTVSVPEMFRYWLQGGRIDVGFLGTAQLDRYANINTTVIGPYDQPKVRLPGAGGAPEIATSSKETLITVKHSRRVFVEKMDFITSYGHGDGSPRDRRGGMIGRGPTRVITDLCVLEPDPETRELVVTALHPGTTREDVQAQTGWPVRFADELAVTEPPSAQELKVLRDLHERTRRAHSGSR